MTRQQFISVHTTRRISHPSGTPHGGKKLPCKSFFLPLELSPGREQPLIPRGHPLNAAPGHKAPFPQAAGFLTFNQLLPFVSNCTSRQITVTEKVWVIPVAFSSSSYMHTQRASINYLLPAPAKFRDGCLHLFQQAVQSHLPYDDKHDQRVSHQADDEDHRVDSSDDDGDGGGDAGVVVLGVPQGPGGIAVVVRPAQEPAAAGAGGTTGPRGAGRVQLLPENLYGGIHRGNSPHGQEGDGEEGADSRRRVRWKEAREGKKQKCYHSHQTLRPLKFVRVKGSSAAMGTVIC